VALVYTEKGKRVTASGAKLNATITSGKGVITVQNGKVTAKKLGRAYIRVSVKNNENIT
jgi:ferric-dicitrate binding protein FerR (iron transport regulator)